MVGKKSKKKMLDRMTAYLVVSVGHWLYVQCIIYVSAS